MSMARPVVTAARIEGRTKSEVARDYRVSRRWVHELVRARARAQGDDEMAGIGRGCEGLPRSRSESIEGNESLLKDSSRRYGRRFALVSKHRRQGDRLLGLLQ